MGGEKVGSSLSISNEKILLKNKLINNIPINLNKKIKVETKYHGTYLYM